MKAVVHDALNYARSLTPGRIGNAFRVAGSYYLSRLMKKDLHSGYPISISIEPTTSCNLRCPQCPSGLRSFTRPTGMLGTELNRKIIDELKSGLSYITYYFQGEPYLNKEFLDMVEYASRHHIYTATSTNAHYLSDENCKRTIESGLKRLIISIDGIKQETYSKYRIGGQLDKVLEGTKNLVEWKKRTGSRYPYIIWQFIAFEHNRDEIPELKKMARLAGVDKLAVKTAQIYDFMSGNELIPQDGKYARYEKVNGQFQIKNKLLNHCWRLWSGSVVTWDGKVVPCCFDKDASHEMGHMRDHSFKTIWKGPSYKAFRQAILRSRKEIDICKNCTEGTKIWA